MGEAFPDAFAFILRIQNAAPSKHEESLLLASVPGSSDFPIAAKQMRPSYEPCGGPMRQYVSATTDLDMDSEEEDASYEARVAYRKAKKTRKEAPRRSRSKSGGSKKVEGDRQEMNGVNRRARKRNRCYACGSEYHLAPKCTQRRQWKPDTPPSPPPMTGTPFVLLADLIAQFGLSLHGRCEKSQRRTWAA